jgi:hypothetical protein
MVPLSHSRDVIDRVHEGRVKDTRILMDAHRLMT